MLLSVAMLAMILVLAQNAAGAGGPPKECAALALHGGANPWERAKAPDLERYCDLLASATAKLAGPAHVVTDVVAIADEADRIVPGHAAAPILRGRALARLGKYPESLEALQEAKTRDELALDEPEALLVWARVLSFTGRTDEALRAYRALMPRASALGLGKRGLVYVGAGMLAMSLGPKGIDESVSILRQARKDSQDVAQRVAALALALALDRSGEKAEARLILGDRARDDAPALLAEPAAMEAMGPQWDVEHDALVAFALEGVDGIRARRGWTIYLEGRGGQGPWADHARVHAAARYPDGGRAR
jgi:tetratricopeptide (TPR) repeat protein